MTALKMSAKSHKPNPTLHPQSNLKRLLEMQRARLYDKASDTMLHFFEGYANIGGLSQGARQFLDRYVVYTKIRIIKARRKRKISKIGRKKI